MCEAMSCVDARYPPPTNYYQRYCSGFSQGLPFRGNKSCFRPFCDSQKRRDTNNMGHFARDRVPEHHHTAMPASPNQQSHCPIRNFGREFSNFLGNKARNAIPKYFHPGKKSMQSAEQSCKPTEYLRNDRMFQGNKVTSTSSPSSETVNPKKMETGYLGSGPTNNGMVITYAAVLKGEVRPEKPSPPSAERRSKPVSSPPRSETSSTSSENCWFSNSKPKRKRKKRRKNGRNSDTSPVKSDSKQSQAKDHGQDTEKLCSAVNNPTKFTSGVDEAVNSASANLELPENSSSTGKDEPPLNQDSFRDFNTGSQQQGKHCSSSQLLPEVESQNFEEEDVDETQKETFWCANSSIAFILAGNEDLSDFDSDWDEVDDYSSECPLDFFFLPLSECIFSMSVISGSDQDDSSSPVENSKDCVVDNDCGTVTDTEAGTCGDEVDAAVVPEESRLDIVNRKWSELYNNEAPSDTSKVHFAEDSYLVEEFPADDEDRTAPWEQMAADRMRFQRQIKSFDSILSPVLTPEYRRNVYSKLYES